MRAVPRVQSSMTIDRLTKIVYLCGEERIGRAGPGWEGGYAPLERVVSPRGLDEAIPLVTI